MRKEDIEQGMKCCNEFLCGECPYEKYDDKVNKEYIMRCIHMLMQDINKLYFSDDKNIEKQLFYLQIGGKMIRERYLISKNDLDKVNNLTESIEVLSRTLIERPDSVNVELYAERIHNAVNSIQNFLIVGETWD